MRIKLLCVGDVVGSPGRAILAEHLPSLCADRQIDCSIVNAENVAGGSGLTPQLYRKLLGCGVDVITMGDHVYRRASIIEVLETSDRMVRPANLPPGAPGREFVVYQMRSGHSVAVASILGRMYMKTSADCPFRTVDRVLAAIPSDVKIIVIDMHAEATSEKIAMGWHLDGRATVVFGTHTHVQTADETILPQGTAYISDVGMTGPFDSVLGRSKERVLRAMITGVPTSFEVASGDRRLCGLAVEVESTTGRAHAVERVCVRAESPVYP
jgi:metallophosphoesterase (TIGR00282 family)